MRTLYCTVSAVVLCLLPSLLLGAAKDEPGEQLPVNYLLDLEAQLVAGKATHVTFAVASQRFEVKMGTDPILHFTGTVSITDGGTLLLTYDLGLRERVLTSTSKEGRENWEYAENGLIGSVRLQEGKQVTLFTMGDRSFKLKVTKLAEE